MDFKVKILEGANGKKVKLQIWDTAGQERYRVLTQSFYKGASGIVLVYSVGDRNSFNDIEIWMKQIEDIAGGNIELMILANKCDL
jgi:small GTP-binding protein